MGDSSAPARRPVFRRVPYCPKCRFDLRMQLKGDHAVCPECGGRWTREELSDASMTLQVRFLLCSIGWAIHAGLFAGVFMFCGMWLLFFIAIATGDANRVNVPVALLYFAVLGPVLWSIGCFSMWWLLRMMGLRRMFAHDPSRRWRPPLIPPVFAGAGSFVLLCMVLSIWP